MLKVSEYQATCMSHSLVLSLASNLNPLLFCISARLGPHGLGLQPLLPLPAPFQCSRLRSGPCSISLLCLLLAVLVLSSTPSLVVRKIIPFR